MEQAAGQEKGINKKKKFVADGLFQAELNSFFSRSLANEGYAGLQVMATSAQTTIVVNATKTNEISGTKAYRLRELKSMIAKRFNYNKDSIELKTRKVAFRGLCAAAQAESLKFKLMSGLPVRMAANGVVKFVMSSGAKGVEVKVSGKLRAQRAKSMKFRDGYMVSSGQPNDGFVDVAVRHVELKQGVLGVKVRIMLPTDPEGIRGPKAPLPDHVEILEPKSEAKV
jgi:small subunit ribosomal protein S3e